MAFVPVTEGAVEGVPETFKSTGAIENEEDVAYIWFMSEMLTASRVKPGLNGDSEADQRHSNYV